MKKFFALLLCVMLIFACCTTAFANENTATPDEPQFSPIKEDYYYYQSHTNPNKLYYSKSDLEQLTADGRMGFRPDFSGMTVTFYNAYRDTTVVAHGDDGEILTNKIWVKNPDEKNQVLTVDAVVMLTLGVNSDGIGSGFTNGFSFEIYYNFDNVPDEKNENEVDKPDEPSKNLGSSTNDTALATADMPTDNNAVQTGNPFGVAALTLCVVSGIAMAAFFARKRFSI